MTPERNGAVRELLIEEYRTLRQESLDSLGHRLTVVNFTFAALSIVIGAMVASDGVSPGLLALLGILFVPQGAKAGLFIWLGEYQRSQRAGKHLVHLEERLNALVDSADGEALCWETSLARQQETDQVDHHMKYPYQATVAFTMGVGWAAEVLGLWYAAQWLDGHAGEPAKAGLLAGAAFLVVAFEILVLIRFFRELRDDLSQFGTSQAPPNKSGMSGGEQVDPH